MKVRGEKRETKMWEGGLVTGIKIKKRLSKGTETVTGGVWEKSEGKSSDETHEVQ